jgi:hypothetical protein
VIALLSLLSFAHAADPAPAAPPAPAAESPAGTPPGAETPAAVNGPLSSWGELRLLGSLPPALTVDPDGTALGQSAVLDTRLRAGVGYARDDWKVGTEWDLFTGQAAGDAWDIPGTEDARDRDVVNVLRTDAFRVRRLAASGLAGPVAIEGGLVTSHWGLGLVANDGAHDPVFGRSDFGDRVLRLRFASRPIQDVPLTFVVAGDRVIDDDTASWSPFTGGQAAWQAVASALYGKADAPRVGAYAVYRNQTEADGERVTSVGVVDLYGDVPVALGGAKLRVAAEAAGILGTTGRSQSYTSRDGLAVASLGATALVELTPEKLPITALVRGGYSTGDGNPDDGTSQDFAFDRDFDAGAVMFDEVQGAVDAAAYAQLTDDSHSGRAPDGAELLVGEGAVRHAAFVQPVVGVQPVAWLGVKAGVVFGWNTSPISQPFATYRNGGVPVNFLGTPTTGYALGTEVDWAVTLGDVKTKLFKVDTMPALLVQGGHYLASADMGGGTHTLVTATGRLRW